MRRTLSPVRAPAANEAAYRAKLITAVREMRKSCLYWLSARYRSQEDLVLDSATSEMLAAFRVLLHRWDKRFRELADTLPGAFIGGLQMYVARRLYNETKQLRDKGLGFNIKMKYRSRRERDVMAAVIAENVNLIKSLASETMTQVEGIVMRAISDGHDLGTLRERLEHQFGASERRAATIARDQTNKATQTLTRARLGSYGITRAIWMHTSAGKTYRESHVELDGEEYDIAEGCYDPAVGRHIQPAELVNCHCVCRPLLPEIAPEEVA